jgi:hypothetical protein
MNNAPDTIQNLLFWLLQKFDPTFSLPSGNGSTSEVNSFKVSSFEVGSAATLMKPAHQKGSEELSSYPSTCPSASLMGASQPRFSAASREGYPYVLGFDDILPGNGQSIPLSGSDTKKLEAAEGASSQTAQSFNFGEIHAVQERFQALLKQRLLSEYANKPPLFPWESEVSEYPAEVVDRASTVVGSPLWSAHMRALNVPGLLPAALINTLLERCQEIARAPIKQGIRLVRAVEDFFPESSDLLEPIANMVLVPAYRSGGATQNAVIQELAQAAGGYESALPEQQIALSMLAAQEILGALTFSVGFDKPAEKRVWLTAVGALDLTVGCEIDPEGVNQLKVYTVLPDSGEICLYDGAVETVAARSQPGRLDLTLADAVVGQSYVLEVSLQGDSQPLTFAIHIEDALMQPVAQSV